MKRFLDTYFSRDLKNEKFLVISGKGVICFRKNNSDKVKNTNYVEIR